MFHFRYRFHSAGQGLFASGTIRETQNRLPFHWVLDCGSTAPVTVLRPEVKNYRDTTLDGFLDLLCISHFDRDHVSGMADLLDGLKVGTIVIPNYSRLERLLLASATKNQSGREADENYLDFLDDPVAFLLEHAESVEEIILIGGDFPDDPRNDEDEDEPPPDEPTGRKTPDAGQWHFKIRNWESLDNKGSESPRAIVAAETHGTSLVKVSSKLVAAAFPPHLRAEWEFLFFHKPLPNPILAALRKGIREEIGSTGEAEISNAFVTALKNPDTRKRIRDLYADALKTTDDDVNSSSLCVYTGPVLDNLVESRVSEPRVKSPSPPPYPLSLRWTSYAGNKVSLLYTGDANLQPSENRVELKNFLNEKRWDHIWMLQVPHHGSRNNWTRGAGDDLNHRISVFCADDTLKRPGHPHREVLLDLLNRGPIVVNKTRSVWWEGSVSHRRNLS